MRTRTCAGGATLLALALWGCDAGGAGGASIVSSPDGVPVVVGSITVATCAQPPSSAVTCSGLAFTIVLSTSQSIDVQGVTIHMIDGTNLGGPMITVPSAQFTDQFGTARVVGGTTRTFTVWPSFMWTTPPRSVVADVTWMDSRGVAHRLTVEGPWAQPE